MITTHEAVALMARVIEVMYCCNVSSRNGMGDISENVRGEVRQSNKRLCAHLAQGDARRQCTVNFVRMSNLPTA